MGKNRKNIQETEMENIKDLENNEEFTETKESVKEKVKAWTEKHKNGIKHTAITAAATVAGGVAGFIGGIAFEKHNSDMESPMEGIADLEDEIPNEVGVEAE